MESCSSYDEFLLVNNVLREYDDMKEEIKSLKNSTVYHIFWYIYKTMLSYCLKCKKKILKVKYWGLFLSMLLSKCEVYDNEKVNIYHY